MDPQTLFYAVVSLVLLMTSSLLVHLFPRFAVGLFLALVAVTSDIRTPITFTATFSNMQVSALDVVVGAMLLSWVYRSLTGARWHAGSSILALLFALGLANVLRGAAAQDFQTVVNEARGWIYLLAPALYCAVSPALGRRWWRTILAVYCSWLIAVGAIGFLSSGVYSATTRVVLNGELVDSRPVTSFGALILLQVLLILISSQMAGETRRLLAPILVITVALLLVQQRTVWLAGGAAIVYLLLSGLWEGGRTRLASLLGFGATGVASVALLISGVLAGTPLSASAEDAASSRPGTLAWRIEGWRDLAGKDHQLFDQLLGQPFGTGFLRVIDGAAITVSPHSHYVETYMRFGAIGVVLTGLLLVQLWRAVPASAPHLGVQVRGLRATVITLVIAGITYRWDPAQGALIGMILGGAASCGGTPSGAPYSLVLPADVPGRRVRSTLVGSGS